MISWLELNKLVKIGTRKINRRGRGSVEVSLPVDLVSSMDIEKDDKVHWYRTHEDPSLVILKFEKGSKE